MLYYFFKKNKGQLPVCCFVLRILPQNYDLLAGITPPLGGCLAGIFFKLDGEVAFFQTNLRRNVFDGQRCFFKHTHRVFYSDFGNEHMNVILSHFLKGRF